jgi:hypothetical protein
MTKRKQVPAVVTSFDSRNLLAPALEATVFETPAPVDDKPARRRISFDYNPGPTSVILLKIMAMERYSANADRLTRQRQFCSRIKGS